MLRGDSPRLPFWEGTISPSQREGLGEGFITRSINKLALSDKYYAHSDNLYLENAFIILG